MADDDLDDVTGDLEHEIGVLRRLLAQETDNSTSLNLELGAALRERDEAQAETKYRNRLLAKANEVLTETRVSLRLTEAERLNYREAIEEQRRTIDQLRAELAVVEGERDDALLTINELTAPAAQPAGRGPDGVGLYLLTDKAHAALDGG